jgi:hypothetical protein
MGIDKELLRFDEFDDEELADAVAMFDVLVGRGDSAGWVNVEPVLDEAELDRVRDAAPPALLRVFSGRGSKIPFATYVPGRRDATRDRPASVGLQHSSGPKAIAQLQALGITAPARWRLRQDHAKRGLVFEVPSDEPGDVLLGFLLLAGRALSGVKFGNEWTAVRHTAR